MDFNVELQKLISRLKPFVERIKEKVAAWSAKKEAPPPASKVGRFNDRYAGTNVKDVKEYFTDFQQKNDMKPGAEDHELSEVIDDLLDQTSSQAEDKGLYAPRRPKPPS